MAPQNPPAFKLLQGPTYRETYANSVQIRVSVWDFTLFFGMLKAQSEHEVEVENFQGVFLSPQQAKALNNILSQNIVNYEQAFGEIKLDPRMNPTGPIH